MKNKITTKKNIILKLLLNQDLTQKQIAEKTNFSESTVSRLIKNLENHVDLKPSKPPIKSIGLKVDLNPFLKILNFTLHNFNEQENNYFMNSKFYKACIKNNEIQDFIFFICTPAREQIFSDILLYLESSNNELIHKFKRFFNDKEKEKILYILSKSQTAAYLVFYNNLIFNELQKIGFNSTNKSQYDEQDFENMLFTVEYMSENEYLPIVESDYPEVAKNLLNYKTKLIEFLESKHREDLQKQ